MRGTAVAEGGRVGGEEGQDRQLSGRRPRRRLLPRGTIRNDAGGGGRFAGGAEGDGLHSRLTSRSSDVSNWSHFNREGGQGGISREPSTVAGRSPPASPPPLRAYNPPGWFSAGLHPRWLHTRNVSSPLCPCNIPRADAVVYPMANPA